MVLQLHIVLGESRQLHHHHVPIRCLEHVDCRGPPARCGGKARDSLLGGQQILKRIPAYESHGEIVPRTRDPGPRVSRSRCATIERFYKRHLWLLYKQRD